MNFTEELIKKIEAEKNEAAKTKKQDDYLHGIGIKSMRHIVEKYHGILNISTKDHIFSINAVFSLSK